MIGLIKHHGRVVRKILVLFSASFFIDGLTGITLAVLGVVTLALLMFLTARLDWKSFFARTPPPLPGGR